MHRPRAMKVHCTGTHSAQQLAALVHMPCMCCPAYGSGCPHAHDAPGGPLAQRLVLLQHLDRAGLRGDQPRRAVAQLPRLIHTVLQPGCTALQPEHTGSQPGNVRFQPGRWPLAARGSIAQRRHLVHELASGPGEGRLVLGQLRRHRHLALGRRARRRVQPPPQHDRLRLGISELVLAVLTRCVAHLIEQPLA